MNSLRKYFIFTAFSICAAGSLAVPRSNQELVNAGHWIYGDVAEICTEAGIVNFADSAPLSIMELKNYLSEIDYSSLSDNSKVKYDRIFKYFEYDSYSFDSDNLSVGIEPSLNVQAFYKNNKDIDWVFDRYNRKPFIFMPVTISGGNWFSMSMDVQISQNKNSALKNDNYSNLPIEFDAIDVNFPETAYFSTGYMITEKTGIGFQLGKGTRSIGTSLTGSMIWSEFLTGVSYAQIEAFSPNFRYQGSVSQFNVDKYMYMHQLDFRFFNKFQFTALEGCLVNAPLEIRYLNPWTIFHGLAPWREYENNSYDSETHVCAYLGLKFQFVPFSNWRIYGNYAQTQMQLPSEKSNNPNDTTPDGIGGQLGSDLFIPVDSGKLHFAIEGSYAQPYLYIKEGPNWTLVRTYCENSGINGAKRHPFYEWIGSPFGPDTVSGEAEISYEVPEKYRAGLIYLFMARGEMSGDNVFTSMKNSDGKYLWGGNKTGNDSPDGWCYPDGSLMGKDEAKRRQSLTTPTGIPEFVNRISGHLTYYFKDSVILTVQPSYVLIFNNRHEKGDTAQGIEFAAAVEIKF